MVKHHDQPSKEEVLKDIKDRAKWWSKRVQRVKELGPEADLEQIIFEES